jgi:Plastocyanin-like domain
MQHKNMNTLKNISLAIAAAIAAGAIPIAMGTSTTSRDVDTSDNITDTVSDTVFIIPWEVITSTSFPPVTTLNVNDSLTFDFKGAIHDVYQFPDKAAYNDCDFSNATEVSDVGPVTINVTEGVTYFGCAVGNHCTMHGMRVAVIV